ncbi:hypothetical protein SAY87_018630 [Trapa incisa]|uniref:Protein kinase domain-containing protein n=1 Tax=Trapa incisa TaxID=236973 RepID=A0AAN7K114_9MYRT|nr:hypothetical protein SAY87_018630 [Trapa incisa]
MLTLRNTRGMSSLVAAELSLLMALLLGVGLTADTGPSPPPKSICKTFCGDLTKIPYPFGIGGEGCFLNEWYEIICENMTTPSLKKVGLEVKNISLPDYNAVVPVQATISVNLPAFTSNESCFSTNRTNQGHPNLEGSPFVYSMNQNILIAVGCNYLAMIIRDEEIITGCNSTCRRQERCFNNHPRVKGCCSSDLPDQLVLQEFSIEEFKSVRAPDDQDDGCSFAFLMDTSKAYDALSNSLYAEGFVEGTLEWGIPGSTKLAQELPGNCRSCQKIYDSTFPDFVERFSCRKGYIGNPYITNGCIDINECEDASICPGSCVNTDGGYHCTSSRSRTAFIVLGLGAGMGLLICLLLQWSYRTVKRTRRTMRKEMLFKRNGGTLLQQQLSSYDEDNARTGRLFSFKELEKATDSFNENRIIGKGGQGTVYKGMLFHGQIVAVKKFVTIEEKQVEQFINEVIILSKINHRNVVKLFGCCLETEVPYLVYEFIPNGTLYSYLHEADGEYFIPWEVRLRLATEVAEALSYLHSAASVPIYYRDIKSSNILLDEKYRAKVADFGSSKYVPLDQTHMTTMVQGTFGYLDPEYFQSSQLTDKSDVYSFGVVLAELLTGEKALSPVLVEEGIGLATYFTTRMEEGRLFDILDRQIMQQAEEEKIMAVANLAKSCLHLNGRSRPTMKEVAIVLEGIRKPLAPVGEIHPNDELSGGSLSIDRTSEASQIYSGVLTSTF